MKKQFIFFLILLFLLGLFPFNFSEAITQNQINAEVQIVCPDSYGNWFSGSGTIIDSKGIILTNKHVVTDLQGGIIKTCAIGFVESINQEPNFYTENQVNKAEVKYYTISEDTDAAILYLENTTNKSYPHVNIWNSNSDTLKFGDKIEVIGYPTTGGSTITYVSGDFSGFGSKSNGTQNYIKTTAPLEHGNSGGASYNSNGEYLGIPSMAVPGPLNPLSYILSINSLTSWLSEIFGINYQEKIKEQKPVIEKPTIYIQKDITPPYFDSGWFDEIYLCNDKSTTTCDKIGSDVQISGSSNKIYIITTNGILSLMDTEDIIIQSQYGYSKKLSDLNDKNEVSYILPNYEHTKLGGAGEKYNLQCSYASKPTPYICTYHPESKYGDPPGYCCYFPAQSIPITQQINLDEPGEYYISIRLIDDNGNVSDKQIFKYLYTKADLNLTCSSFTYSDWSSCSSNNQQTRSVISSSPSGCEGGSPILIQSCTYTPIKNDSIAITPSNPPVEKEKTPEQPKNIKSQKESIAIEATDANPAKNNATTSEDEKENKNNLSSNDSEQRRSMVANAVQEIINVADHSGGIGQEIKIIAQTQTQNHEKLEVGVQKVKSRSAFARFFIGPNYSEIKNSQKILEQSKEQIQELDALRVQVADQGDQLQIMEQVRLLEQANQQIEASLSEAQKGFSLFGWMFRFFAK